MTDEELMDHAIELAAACTPSKPSIPKVGCVIAIDAVTKVAYMRGEDDHAEKRAILAAVAENYNLSEATVYTTLEPCTYHSRRNPGESCTERLIAMRVRKVWVGSLDPNQDICGRGVLALQRAGIEVAFFPHKKVAAIQQINAEFICVQQTIGMTLTDPACSPQVVKAGNVHDISGEYLNKPEPGDLHLMVGNKEGIWWPQQYQVEFLADKKWRARFDLTHRGEFVVALVRANGLGRALIQYFERVKNLRAERRRALISRIDAANRGLLAELDDTDWTRSLGSDWTGINLSLSLPKGLDPQIWLEYRVT